MAYSPTSWKRGDIITAEKLNKVETGLQAVASVDIQSAQATTLAAGAPATAVIEGGVLKLGIPRGQTGAQGAAGAQGAKGDKGETGATPTITATATVDATVGTPKVTVSKGGTTTAPTFTFAFTGLKGATGAQGVAGATGAKGERGAAGAAGKNGSCFRVSATALADSQTGIAATAFTPTNAQLPYAVGDIVLDATTKKLYAITAASGGTCSIGTALATLP
jgi:hypothetical protein